ncbi:HAD family hydrolase [Sandaracinobacteroides saxicola]|uniref:HAD family phosphatase n=1 Tax=Sandaracinobacteroides saxicola TaxID=2759707 RepID=A0A7G5IF36_9SPHN|nr:HAD family phosphatase [Sandaracinobacteroides saxicola]QMW21978.1 HAD family phosphatase [Sandaracinobacteroides saxicola]
MTIRAAVFDVGHVLYDWDPRYLYAKLIPDPARLDWFLSHVVTHAWHFQHDAGRAFADTSAELIAQYPAERALIELYAPRWLETVGDPVPGMAAIVAALHARGVPLYAITNFSAEFWSLFRPTAPVFDAFTDIIVSGAERLVKPDPAIYALAKRRFTLDTGEAIFIDDRPDNVAAAEAAGWIGHQFTDAASLKRRLTHLKLLG